MNIFLLPQEIFNALVLTAIFWFSVFCTRSGADENLMEARTISQQLESVETIFTQAQANRCTCLILQDGSPYSATATASPILNLLVSQSAIQCQRAAGIFLVKVGNYSNFTSVKSFSMREDVGKVRPTCTLGLIYIFDSASLHKLHEWFSFLQSLHGIVKTYHDQFVFSSNTESVVDSMLTSESFGNRIKFAVGLSLEKGGGGSGGGVRYLCQNGCGSNNYYLQTTSVFHPSLIFDKTKNFYGKTLKVSTPTSTRWLNEMHTVDNKWIPKRGIYSIVLDHLMIKYNFSGEFIPSTGGGTGTRINKTIWVGTVGDVLYRKADIGHVTAVTLQRALTVDSTFPISYEWLTFTTGKAREYHSWKTIYWPLTPFIWQLTAGTSVLVLILFKVVLRVTRQRGSVGKLVEYMLAVVTEEGVKDPEQYPTHSLRVTIVIWLIFSLLIGTAYKSKLTAFLAFPHLKHLPQSFEELSESGYMIGLQYIKGAAYQILKSSKNPTYVSIFKRMELEESDVKCFKRTMESKFACISWDSIADYAYHKNLTDKYGQAPVVKSPASTCFLTAGMVMEKRSILKTNFDHFLIWAMDTGMVSKWTGMDHDNVSSQRKHWERETHQPEIDYTPPANAALTFSHLSGGYYLFSVGLITSLIVALAEIIIGQHRKCMSLDNKPSGNNSRRHQEPVGTNHVRISITIKQML